MQGLMLHKGTHEVGRSELSRIATPESTPTWRPVPHIELVETLEASLEGAGYTVGQETFGAGRKGALLFGVMRIKNSEGGLDGEFSVGLRQANDRTMSVQICAGFSVFVCDNLVFRGDMIALRRKHTTGLELRAELDEAVEKLRLHFHLLDDEMTRLKGAGISDVGAKAVLHEVFVEQKLMPMRYLEPVSGAYFKPPHREFEPRTMWSLHNAFTEVAKQMPITTRFPATQRIGRYFGLTSQAR